MYRVGRLRLYLSIIIILLLETSLLHRLSINNIRPNLMLIFIIFVGLYSDWREVLEAGIIGGLLRGALTTSPVGINLTILCLCGLITTYCKNKVYKESFLTQITMTLFVGLTFNILTLLCGKLVGDVELMNAQIHRAFTSAVILVSVYTSLIAPPTFFCLKKLLKAKTLEYYL
jgi:rod shape-determining protein MreD